MHDIAIRGGVVIDGTGGPARRGDIGITSGRVTAIGEVGPARQTIEADGQVVAPGFVDVHTHIDAQVCWDTTLGPSSLHGVTTMLAGNCGFTLAPINDHEADYLVRMLAIVEGMPLDALQAGVACTWTSTGEYLDHVDRGLAVNAGFMVGHSALRRVVMREEATKRTATEAEIETMVRMLRAGLGAGALGFSSSYGIAHSDANGDPVPSRFAPVDELVALARQCRDFPGTSLEFLPKFVDRFDPDQAALLSGLSVAAQRPLNWTCCASPSKSSPKRTRHCASPITRKRKAARSWASPCPSRHAPDSRSSPASYSTRCRVGATFWACHPSSASWLFVIPMFVAASRSRRPPLPARCVRSPSGIDA